MTLRLFFVFVFVTVVAVTTAIIEEALTSGARTAQVERRGKGIRRIIFAARFSAVAMLIASAALYGLVFALVSSSVLWLIYLLYTIAVILMVHGVFFCAEFARLLHGRHLSKAVPKYLEYGYTAFIAGSLLQVFVYTPRIADYVTWLQGDETYLAHEIQSIAKRYVDDECVRLGTRTRVQTGWFGHSDYFFTPEYCETLRTIANANKDKIVDHVADVIEKNPSFPDHTIEDASDWEWVRLVQSPIRDLASRFVIVREFVRTKGATESVGSNRMAWIGMLLLPLGIALRLVKTSLELFVPLE